jgi:hypothetical protein
LEQITLLDQNGKLLMEKELVINRNETKISLPPLAAGTYILRIGRLTRRLVITR